MVIKLSKSFMNLWITYTEVRHSSNYNSSASNPLFRADKRYRHERHPTIFPEHRVMRQKVRGHILWHLWQHFPLNLHTHQMPFSHFPFFYIPLPKYFKPCYYLSYWFWSKLPFPQYSCLSGKWEKKNNQITKISMWTTCTPIFNKGFQISDTGTKWTKEI